ncbi:MAG: FadR/GntR family transcriptional regulator [Egibacteraceae bacterium]
MRFERVEREPVHRKVAERIRQTIRAGLLAPGEELPAERELAEQLGVGRTSIREAIRELEAEGLLTRSGTTSLRMTVAQPSMEPVLKALRNTLQLAFIPPEQLVDLRCGLETMAVERAVDEPQNEQRKEERADCLQEAREALAIMRARDASIREFSLAHTRFHIAIVGASGNQLIYGIMQALEEPITQNIFESLMAQTSDAQEGVRQQHSNLHEELIRQLDAGHADRARQIVYDDIMGFYTDPFAPRQPFNADREEP